jgi:segregation and condensation protein A
MTFRELTGSLVDRLEIVVRFLAILELYKQGLVELDQFTSFGDITISWIGGDVADAEEGGWMRAMATMDSYDG